MPYTLQPGESITVPLPAHFMRLSEPEATITLNERPQWAFEAMASGEPVSFTFREKTLSGQVTDIRQSGEQWVVSLYGEALVYT